jgi:hydrogenase maturation protein HypF
VQAAAGWLPQVDVAADLSAEPFNFPDRFFKAGRLVTAGLRTFRTHSAGRLFDCAAALLGFTRPSGFEGQAAMRLEHLAGAVGVRDRGYECPSAPGPTDSAGTELDWRPLLRAVMEDRIAGIPPADIAFSFHAALARAIAATTARLAREHDIDTVVLSGGVFQNQILLRFLHPILTRDPRHVWLNRLVPANDGGVSLGQAALGA